MAQINVDKFKDEFKDRKFTGYVWMSDESGPAVLRDQPLDPDKLQDGVNPFIVEALLVAEEKSYTIRNIDGRIRIDQYALPEKEDDKHTRVSYIAHRMTGTGVRTLSFYQEWEAREDPMCEDMEVLEPGALIFAGFDKWNDKAAIQRPSTAI